MSERLLAVLVATDRREGLSRAVGSLQAHGIHYVVWGLARKWEGNGMKQIGVLEVAKTRLGHFDHILFMDGYDTLCLADVDEILEKFLAFKNPMVISGEINCWPDAKLASRYPPATTKFRFLNTGLYMARTEYLVKVLPQWGVNPSFHASSDQRFITGKFLEDQSRMRIDTECILFQSLCGQKPPNFDVEGKRVINKVTSQKPCLLHGNGHTNMDWYWKLIQ